MQRADEAWARSRLQAATGAPQKSLGQHFLVDPAVITQTLAAASVSADDAVIEIGPGLGVLSAALLETGAKVTAFELDPIMCQVLAEDLPSLTVVQGDVLLMLPEHLPGGAYKVVANIPYQITTPLIELLFQGKQLGGSRPQSATLLMQKEVAERLSAKPGDSDRSFLSVVSEYVTDSELVCVVPPSSFWPAPAVDSAVLHMVTKTTRAYGDEPEKERKFFSFVRSLFAQRRKQLKNVVAGIRGISSEEVSALFAKVGLPATARAQELSLDQWQQLFEAGA